MLYHLLYPLHTEISAFNVFRYITFRSAYAMVTALVISFLLGPAFIRVLRRIQMFQVIREEGPKTHQAKAGTPTMGGLLILTAIVVPSLLWCNLTNRYVQIALIYDGVDGRDRFPRRLPARGQAAPEGPGGSLQADRPDVARARRWARSCTGTRSRKDAGTLTSIPFAKGLFINFGPFFILLVALVVTGTSNAVNSGRRHRRPRDRALGVLFPRVRGALVL